MVALGSSICARDHLMDIMHLCSACMELYSNLDRRVADTKGDFHGREPLDLYTLGHEGWSCVSNHFKKGKEILS